MDAVSGSSPIQPDLLPTVREALADRYDVHEEIGRGGMAMVFRATRRLDGRELALKVLDPRLSVTVGRDRFRREIAILSQLSHPAILPHLETGESGDLLYFAMPLVNGETLRERLNREPQLPVEEALGITRTILDALQYAHGRNVIHRDIKPENILLQDGQVLVADFGIARAIVRSGGDRISTTGVTIGTPAYMSPEQVVGEARLDGRSDIYSTGCVLYEMLAGGPPFGGPTPQAIQARHMHEAPPPLRVVRPSVPEALQRVLETALAKVAADRFRTASEFSAALDRALEPGVTVPVAAIPRRRLALLGAAGLVVAVLAVMLWPTAGPALEPERYVVLPFRNRGTDQPGPISADNATRLVWQSLSRWRDLQLVEADVVEDRTRRPGASYATLSSGMELARSLGAGLLVWGEVLELGDSVSVRASVFRASDRVPEALRRAELTVLRTAATDSGSAGQLIRQFAELARNLILPSLEGVGDPGEPAGTASYNALRATLSGDSALLRWNLDLARERYRQAFVIDPGYAAPRLRYARASLWADAPVSEWRPAAEAALGAANQLSPVEQLEAKGLAALGQREFPEACGHFREILRRDSSRFAGWYGIGECLTGDDIVIRDPGSPSGWRFRGGYASGIAAFQRALTLVPLAHAAFGGAALGRLSSKLMVDPNRARFGIPQTDSTIRMAAYPELREDSVAFVPYPIEEITRGTRQVRTRGQALNANRRALLQITTEWLARYPESPSAISAHAQALEMTGSVASNASEEVSALSLVRKLRTGTEKSSDISLAAWEVRLRLKARQFTAARVLAESALAVLPRTDLEGAIQAALAALTGRVNLAAELYGRSAHWPFVTPDGRLVQSPPAVTITANRLLVYAAFGTPEDSIRVLTTRLRTEIERSVDPSLQQDLWEAAIYQPSLLAFPLLPPPASQQLPTARVEMAIARRDHDLARLEFAALNTLRQFELPGNIALDHAVLEARLLAFLGDSAAARARLEPFLDNPAGLGTEATGDVTQAVAVGRVMLLWRELRGLQGAGTTDSSLIALWLHADERLGAKMKGQHPH